MSLKIAKLIVTDSVSATYSKLQGEDEIDYLYYWMFDQPDAYGVRGVPKLAFFTTR